MLNSHQLQAVRHTGGPLLILAGAGAGKTHTVVERVVYLISECGVPPDSILCVTFTNKAAKEMRERIFRRIGITAEAYNPYRSHGLPLIGTFHSIGIYFLRLFAESVGLSKSFLLYDEDDKSRIIKDIMKSLNVSDKELKPREIIGAISSAKSRSQSADGYRTEHHGYSSRMIGDIYAEYEKIMKKQEALDFDDILGYALQVVKNPTNREYFHNRFVHIIVDEYQDTNTIQYEMVRLLAERHRQLAVVGDDAQGIYSWRGATIRNILSFQKDYPDATIVKLEQNYRSTQTILAAANSVIKQNTENLEKTLWTENPQGKKVILAEAMNDKHEGEIVANMIKDANVPYSHWAILYRTNSQSRVIEESLMRRNIPYRVYGGLKFYERKEIKDILAYIRFLFNPSDRASLRRIINVPGRKIGDKSVDVLFEYMEGYGMGFFEVADRLDEVGELGGAGRTALRIFGETMKKLLAFMETHTVRETMTEVIETVRYREYLDESAASEDDAQSRRDNITEFANLASRYDGMEHREAFYCFLEDIGLMTDADENKADRDQVSLMSIHLSKGLEFRRVVIVGAEEGLFPHSRVLLEKAGMEEERRLMYVAMTRAREELTICRARERFSFGTFAANPPSRFIKEIDPTLVEEYRIPGS